MKFPYLRAQTVTDGMHGFFLIDNDAYHAGAGVSSSKVKRALKSFDCYQYQEQEESDALWFGRAFHSLLLEPEVFHREWAVDPGIEGNKNSNAYKAEYAAWLAKVPGKNILARKDYATICGMIETVKAHPEYSRLAAYDAEVMAVAKCPETGLTLKCKADLFGSAIIDAKSTNTWKGGVRPAEITNAMVSYGYHISAAFYTDVIELVLGHRLPFIVVPVTKSEPYECEFYQVSDDLLEEGRKLYKAGLRRIKKWSEQGPGERLKAEKKIRVLQVNPRVLYNTRDVLDFLEA